MKIKAYLFGCLFMIDHGINLLLSDGYSYNESKAIVASGVGTTVLFILLGIRLV